MSKTKYIYFDIGGVMCDTSNYFKGVTTKFNIQINEFIEFWQGDNFADEITRGKITSEDFWNRAIKKFDLKDVEDFNFVESWMDDYKPRLEVHELAKKLSEKYKVGLISNLYPGMMPALITKGLVADINYSSIVLSCEVGLRKPEKEIYELATKKASVNTEEILFIDDRKDFIDGAIKYGWQTVWFDLNNKEKVIKEIEKILEV